MIYKLVTLYNKFLKRWLMNKTLLILITLISINAYATAPFDAIKFINTLPVEDIEVLQDYAKNSNLISTYYGYTDATNLKQVSVANINKIVDSNNINKVYLSKGCAYNLFNDILEQKAQWLPEGHKIESCTLYGIGEQTHLFSSSESVIFIQTLNEIPKSPGVFSDDKSTDNSKKLTNQTLFNLYYSIYSATIRCKTVGCMYDVMILSNNSDQAIQLASTLKPPVPVTYKETIPTSRLIQMVQNSIAKESQHKWDLFSAISGQIIAYQCNMILTQKANKFTGEEMDNCLTNNRVYYEGTISHINTQRYSDGVADALDVINNYNPTPKQTQTILDEIQKQINHLQAIGSLQGFY